MDNVPLCHHVIMDRGHLWYWGDPINSPFKASTSLFSPHPKARLDEGAKQCSCSLA
uniref:Uncharacterized protein n=1 Tax=Arundo donax TaxID=35708 RepID=A0A0A9EEY9_ARUDO